MGMFSSCDSDAEVKRNEKADLTGPLDKRSVKDVLWLLLFLVFWGGMLTIGGYAYYHGQPLRLIYGMDSFGNICGQQNEKLVNSTYSGLDMTNYTNLFYFDNAGFSFEEVKGLSLCVANCPDDEVTCTNVNDAITADCPGFAICLNEGPYGPVSDHPDIASADSDHICPDATYPSSDILGLGGRCVPQPTAPAAVLKYFWDNINSFQTLQEIFSDFAFAWQRMLYIMAGSFGFALLVVFSMRCLVAPIVYGLILAAWGSFTVLTIFLIYTWRRLQTEWDDTPSDERYDSDEKNLLFFKVTMSICIVLWVIFSIILIAMRERIRIAVNIMEEASVALGSMPQIFLTPVLTYFWLIVLFVYWVCVYVYLATSGQPYLVESIMRVRYKDSGYYQEMWWYHLFGLFWTSQFILAAEEVVIAGCVAAWYFTRDKSKMSHSLSKSIGRTIVYHLGSVALGSLIIAIIQIIRVAIGYAQRKLQAQGGAKWAVFLLKCLGCCMWCFEKCMRFINRNAYIEIAIFGYSFCTAACQAFKTLLSNILRVAALNFIGAFVLAFMKFAVASACAFVAILVFRHDSDLHYYGIIVLVIFVFAWFVADAFTDIYKMVIDTILICFCEDGSRNNGKDKPYFATKRLVKFLKSSSKKDDKKEDDKKEDDSKAKEVVDDDAKTNDEKK